MEGSNYYAPEGINSGRRNDNRYQQQQQNQYSYGRPNLSQEHQLFQENQSRNNKNNNDVYNYSSHLSPGNQPSIYPPPSLQNQQNIHKSLQMKMVQNQQFPSSSNNLYPPSSSNRPYKEFSTQSSDKQNNPYRKEFPPSSNYPYNINERPPQSSQNKAIFPPSPSYNQVQMRLSQPSQNKKEFSEYSPPPAYNQIPSTNFPPSNNQMFLPSSQTPSPSYNQMGTPSSGTTALNPNEGFPLNPSLNPPNGRLPAPSNPSPNLQNPSPNPMPNSSQIKPQQNDKIDKIPGQVDHSIPPVERSLAQLTSLEQVWDMPLINDGKPTYKFWFCKIFILLLVLSCLSVGITIKITLNNLSVGSDGLIGSSGNKSSNKNCNVVPNCGKTVTTYL